MQAKSTVNPALCPLCRARNACGNLDSSDAAAAICAVPMIGREEVVGRERGEVTKNGAKARGCWCMDPRLVFPQSLLAQVPADAKNTACICEGCTRMLMSKL